MNNNNNQPLGLSLRVFDNGLGIPKIKSPDVTTQYRGKQPSPSICKVSRILRDLSESSFTPQLVSIGPIHRDDPNLKEFEGLKEGYRNDLLNRCEDDSTPMETILEACLQKVKRKIPQIRESYSDVVIKNYKDDELARMMVMDGCFILEFCFKHEEENKYLPNKMQNTRIALDLMLLENQVPFVVLQALFDCSMGKVSFTLSNVLDEYLAPYIKLFCRLPEKKSILELLISPLLPEENSTTYVDSDLSEKISTIDVSDLTPAAHVLGYLHQCYQLVDAKSSNREERIELVDEELAAKSSNPVHAEASKLVDEELAAKSSNPVHAEASKLVDEEGRENIVFPSIVELERSGMKLKPHQENVWSMTIKFQSPPFPCLSWFWSKPTLLMPTLVINDMTELILRNFIAYEQSFPQDRYYFTSYAGAMDMLINTQEDIAKLVESKVLVNILGSNQEAADMIHKICKNISITDFYFTQQFKQMDKYYDGYWPKNIARLRRVYFFDSWKAIAVNYSIIVFFLTVAQTYYTIKSK